MPSGNVLNLHSRKCLRTCFTVSVQETVSLPFSILIGHNRYAITFVGPDLWAYRLAVPLGSMKYLGNFLSSHRNQESAI